MSYFQFYEYLNNLKMDSRFLMIQSNRLYQSIPFPVHHENQSTQSGHEGPKTCRSSSFFHPLYPSLQHRMLQPAAIK